MMPSWLMAGRIVALPLWLAHAVQAAMAVAATVMVCRVFRGEGEWHLQIALLFVATLAASPQGFNYDIGLISVVLICLISLARHADWRRGEFIIVALCWVLPLVVMSLSFAGAPIAPLLLTELLVYLYCRRDMRPEPGRDPG